MATDQTPRQTSLDMPAAPEAHAPKKHNISKQTEQTGFNTSFLTPANMRWFARVVDFLPDPAKPLVFLPCGSAAKTREKFGKKMISQGLGHQLMSAVTREPSFERVILSEPLTIIPYALEGQHPDYNLPPAEHPERAHLYQDKRASCASSPIPTIGAPRRARNGNWNTIRDFF